MITRFAPSPTGFLHLGHAYAAEQAFGFAKAQGGTCLLRIEDIDHTRCKPEFTQAIYDDLRWLGFDWPEPVRVQSAYTLSYYHVLDALYDKGLIYRCFLTRKAVQAAIEASGGTVYRGPKNSQSEAEQASRVDAGDAYAWRLSMARAKGYLGEKFGDLHFTEVNGDGGNPAQISAKPWRYGDEIIGRKDIGISYHLCVTCDDSAQNVSHVVRGQDFAELTGFHVLLQALMGWPTPIYHHHNLLLRDDGEKLAKRNSDTAIRTLREQGLSPADVLKLARAGAAR